MNGPIPDAGALKALSDGLGPGYLFAFLILCLLAWLVITIVKRDREKPHDPVATMNSELVALHRRLDGSDAKHAEAAKTLTDLNRQILELNGEQRGLRRDVDRLVQRDEISRVQHFNDRTVPPGR